MPTRAHNTNGKKSQTSNQYPNQANIILTDDHEARDMIRLVTKIPDHMF
jgi:hypothetical protein